MNKEQIFVVIKENTLEVLFDLNADEVQLQDSLRDLGANSIDRADIVTQSMADLEIKMPLVALGEAKNLSDLVDMFYKNQ